DPLSAVWRDVSRRRGFGSVLSLPLRVDGEIFGALTIGAPEPDAFCEQERAPLMEAADDLAFGLATLRTRQRAAAAEQTIRRMTYYDALTGLPNRVLLREQLAQAIASAKEERRPLALVRVEVEHMRE